MFGQSNLGTFVSMLIFVGAFIMLLVFFVLAMATTYCPELVNNPDIVDTTITLNDTSQQIEWTNNPIGYVLEIFNCTGIPWWVYALIFIPLIAGVIIYALPFTGG